MPIAFDDGDRNYEYIYCSFIDNVKYVIKHSSLENHLILVDLTKCFKNFGMPKYIYLGVADAKIINEAVSILNKRNFKFWRN